MTNPEQLPDSGQEKQHPFSKLMRQLGWRAWLNISSRVNPGVSHKDVSNPARVSGLIRGAIIGNMVWCPDLITGELSLQAANRGSWVGWDANRQNEFPLTWFRGLEIIRRGGIVASLIDEVVGNDPDMLTPTGLLRLHNLDHAMSFDPATPEQLVSHGLARAMTLESAYRNLGLEVQYGDDLRSRGVADHPVWQITPKGNTLVHLLPPIEDPRSQITAATQRPPIPGLVPSPATI